MLYKLIDTLDRLLHFDRASAHCDIPCGIYDPSPAQIAALTVIRMTDLITELAESHDPKELEYQYKMTRYIATKEEHAVKVKEEIHIIWGDYIKPEHVEQHPDLNVLVHKLMKVASKTKQDGGRDVALELLELVNRFAEIFWETKGIQTKKAKAPYLPGEIVVYPVL